MRIDYKEIEFIPLNEYCKNRNELSQVVSDFSSGDMKIDSFIKNYYAAYYNHILGLATTNLLVYREEVIGFFTSRCTSFPVDNEESKRISSEIEVPAVELSYIAVDERYQEQGIGTYVIKVLIGQAMALNKTFACRYFFLRSVPEKVAYYSDPEVLGFEQVSIDEEGLHLMKYYIPDFNDFTEFEDHLESLNGDSEADMFFKELDRE
ncbi:GNAT family N-acetyltransferase [Priestia endophytica]|uniref:GNAT family N-acetyltransferase n=1 Tax=Priestia endophytica TaxID=135735 RepID=UPI00227EA97D|nr:GNAT family N-acetyltransferase [Priestia endophytica]MCY8235533.1 hypothetical protein [Priestia endophytica]